MTGAAGQERQGGAAGSSLTAALVLLNASLTFGNIWPTPAIRWQGELSVELASFILLLVIASRWLGPPSRAALGWLSALWVLLAIGRYADVTAPALYGRDINLYWDLRYVPDVVSMLVRVAPLVARFARGGEHRAAAVRDVRARPVGDATPRHRHARRTRTPAARGAGGRGDAVVCRSASERSASGHIRESGARDLRAASPARHRGGGRVDLARPEPTDGFRPGTRQGRGRPPGVPRVVRRGELRPAGIRSAPDTEPRRARGC